MELKGLSDFVIGMMTDKGKLIVGEEGLSETGLFKVDLSSSKGATQANITNLNPTVTKVYGSNSVAEQQVGVASPSVALAANDIPHLIYDKVMGMEADKTNTGMAVKFSKAALAGVIAHSTSLDGSVDAYMAFPLGVVTPGDLALATDQENPTVVHDALTLAAQARPSDNLLYQKFYSDDPEFDYEKMLAFIFDGYKVATPPTEG